MNILGHCLLSGDDPHLLIGNFIADGLPRSKWSKLPASIQKGVRLHHFIDTFTDSHPKIQELIASLRPSQGKYAPVVSDLLIDHVLARDWDRYASIPLADFVHRVHTELNLGTAHMTEGRKRMFSFMRQQNWLLSYAEAEGIQMALRGMHRRSSFPNRMNEAYADYLMSTSVWDGLAGDFLQDVISAAAQKRDH